MQRIALIVVEEEISRRRRGARADQTANDAAAAKRQLIRIREIDLGAVAEPGRAKRQLPAVDSRGLHVNRKEDVGVIQAVVVEEVGGASQKIIGIQDPAFEGNSGSELMFLVPLAMQRHEIKPLVDLDIV